MSAFVQQRKKTQLHCLRTFDFIALMNVHLKKPVLYKNYRYLQLMEVNFSLPYNSQEDNVIGG